MSKQPHRSSAARLFSPAQRRAARQALSESLKAYAGETKRHDRFIDAIERKHARVLAAPASA